MITLPRKPNPRVKEKPIKAPEPQALADGQLWQMKDCYLQIAHLGKTLAEYKILRKPGQRAVQSQMGSFASVLTYLKANDAKLLAPVAPPPKAPKKRAKPQP